MPQPPLTPTIGNTAAGIGRQDLVSEGGGGVSALHPRYEEFFDIWRKCRDAYDGEDAVKEESQRYLPKLGGMDDNDYDGYIKRALFYGATGRTVSGLLGHVFRKPPDVRGSEKFIAALGNITGTGETLEEFAAQVVEQQLVVGRVGVMLDMPPNDQLPYLRIYTSENVTNWREVYVNGIPTLDQVIVHEVSEIRSVDGFGSDYIERYRVLELTEQGFYQQRLFELQIVIDSGTGEEKPVYVETETLIPKLRGRPFTYIPFVIFNAANLRVDCHKPPLLDLVNVNLSHYRSSADLEHGRHFTALPTLYVTGVDQNEDEDEDEGALRVGSGTAWVLPMNAEAGILEFHGQGLKHLENALVEKQEQMVTLGARMLEGHKRAAETAEVLRLRQAGDAATLVTLVETTSKGLTRACRWFASWMELPDADEVLVTLNEDFFDNKLTPQELNALVKSWQEGALAYEDLHRNLVRGEVIDKDRKPEQVLADVLKEKTVREFLAEIERPPEPVRDMAADGSPRQPIGPQRGVGSGNA